MTYKSLKDCIVDLEAHGHLKRITAEVDPNLEMAAIHRRFFYKQGPALYYEKVKGSPFPAVSNLFGTLERSRFIFRKSLNRVKTLFQIKGNPAYALKHPLHAFGASLSLLHAYPKKVSTGPVFKNKTTIKDLPQIKCWPQDGGAFILLPQVYTEDPANPHIFNSNLGMYRVQLSGNEYEPNREIGLHYQLRRDIGIHHTRAKELGKPLRVSIFIGGPPAHTFSAVMFLPENLPEIAFAGALGARRFRYAVREGYKVSVDADFCITGLLDPEALKPEGPFGDHLGYYSLKHLFPYLKVEDVYHRDDAIWPFTVVGRPPQEDTSFGKLIQEIAGPVIQKEIPGIKAVHAVDEAGVHPLMLAIGSERFFPYGKQKPRELLKLSHALLGYGPCSLAKYLLIVDGADNPRLDIHNVESFFSHLLERINWATDLHFETETTMDTLDYSGPEINAGSKVVMAACGTKKRDLVSRFSEGVDLPDPFSKALFAMPGVMILQTRAFENYDIAQKEAELLGKSLEEKLSVDQVPLIVLADDSDFTTQSFRNFLWITFTRSNPSHDIYGVRSFQKFKHWGCLGPLIIDARLKPHHAPPLEEDDTIRSADVLKQLEQV